MPAPEIEPSKAPVPLPNVLAVTRSVPRPVREFTAPVVPRQPVKPLALPEAPRTGSLEAKTLPVPASIPKPQPRAFVPPEDIRPQTAAPLSVPEAPTITGALRVAALPFATPAPKPQPRAFVPPALPRAFWPTYDSVRAAPPPAIEPAAPEQASLAIVGLDPAKVVDFPAPPGPREAGFSGGPQPHPEGAATEDPANATIVVPGLLAHARSQDDRPVLVAALAPTTRERLAASVRIAPRPADPSPSEPRATRVAEAPDPLLEGRTVYMVAIQMPNVTSYSEAGWCGSPNAIRRAGAGAAPVRPPEPLHKVDPKYIATAVDERIEGKVAWPP